MKTIEEIKDLFLDVESEYTFKIKQYTIDLWERIYDELYNEEMTVTEESYIGSLQYKLSTFLEICDKSLVDYEFISKLYNIFGGRLKQFSKEILFYLLNIHNVKFC